MKRNYKNERGKRLKSRDTSDIAGWFSNNLHICFLYTIHGSICGDAHIYALSDDGPRGKQGLTEQQRNHQSNLLLLCPTHHTVVDSQHESYPASTLLSWKLSHERKFDDTLAAKVSDVGFNELEIAARAVRSEIPTAD
jgi:hypothetical protein